MKLLTMDNIMIITNIDNTHMEHGTNNIRSAGSTVCTFKETWHDYDVFLLLDLYTEHIDLLCSVLRGSIVCTKQEQTGQACSTRRLDQSTMNSAQIIADPVHHK